MKSLPLIAIVLAFSLLSENRPASAEGQGGAANADAQWSKVANGLRARLFFKRREVLNGTPILSTYLVLQNVSDVLGPLKVAWASERMKFRVVDAAGKELPHGVGSYDGLAFLGPMDLLLPLRGELSFDISCSGLGIAGDQAALIDLGPSENWTIPKDAGDCFMHATLEIEKVKRSRDNSTRVWDGRLELPPVKIPTGIEPLDPTTIDARINELGAKMLLKNGSDSEEAGRALSLIDDPHVIPWYIKALETDSYSLKFAALDRLARFNTDEALAGLKKGIATRGADIGNRSTDELGEQLAINIRHSAAQALARSPHADAKRELLTLWNHSDAGVRLDVLHVLGRMDTPESLELIKKMTADQSQMVRGEAERYLKLRSKP
jgi:hypothetical protein